MSTLPPGWDPSDDADEQYRRASELDPSRPSEATRRAVLAHAARLAAERAGRTAHRPWLSFAGVTSGWRPALIGTVAAAALAGVVIAPQYLAPRSLEETRSTAPPTAPAVAERAPAAAAAPRTSVEPTRQGAPASQGAPAATLGRSRVPSSAGRPVAQEPAPVTPAPALAARDAMTTLQAEERAEENSVRVMAPAAAKARAGAAQAPPPPARGNPGALWQAAAAGDIAALNTELTNGGDIDSRDADGRTALMLATVRGQTRAVAVLLAHGADPNAADAHGTTPLEAAVAADQREIVAALRRYGAR